MPAIFDPVVLIVIVVVVAAGVLAVAKPKYRQVALGILVAGLGYIGLRALGDLLKPKEPLPGVPNKPEVKPEKVRAHEEAAAREEAEREAIEAAPAHEVPPELSELEKRAQEAAARRDGGQTT